MSFKSSTGQLELQQPPGWDTEKNAAVRPRLKPKMFVSFVGEVASWDIIRLVASLSFSNWDDWY